MSNLKLSPNEKALLNRQEYSAYVESLEATGAKFPLNQFDDVNLTAIAKICGFKRGVLQDKDSFLGKQLRLDVSRIGTEIQEAVNNEGALEKKAKKASMNASKLEKELEIATGEIEELRLKLEQLEAENYKLTERQHEQKESYEHMLDTGKRVFI
jgi:septal ring factor EnvC (AmiA/AmiB activator)